MKITSLQLENVKRVKALRLEPSPQGLTVIGGKNQQGKTSVLDAIVAALGGQKKVPSRLTRDGAMNHAAIRVELSNGLVAERKGKNATLTVTDPSGKRAGQKLLDKFISSFALDLPAFLEASPREKARHLLDTLGIADKLDELERREKALYDERTILGRQATAKAKYAEELPEYPDAPAEPLSVASLIQEQQAVLQRNAERKTVLDNISRHEERIRITAQRVEQLKADLAQAEDELRRHQEALAEAQAPAQTAMESTAQLEQQIAEYETINQQVSVNLTKAAATDEAAELQRQYDAMTQQVETVRTERMALLDGCELPLNELTVEDGELVYRGHRWDCMSGAEQLQVSVAIATAMRPDCRFVLVDKLEQMDSDTMAAFGQWAKEHDLQIIATRVSTDPDECTIVIEDGLPVGSSFIEETTGIKDDVTTSVTTDDDFGGF